MAGRQLRRRRRSLEVLAAAAGRTGCCGSRSGRRRWRPRSPCCSGCRRRTCCTGCAFPGRRLLRALLLVPFVLPTVVVGVAFRQLLGDGGPLGWPRPRRHPGGDHRRRWRSSTSPSWSAPSAPRGSRSTRARARRPRRSAPRPGRCSARSPCPRCARPIVSRGQRGLPLLRHRVRGRADPRRAALLHGRDRDLPAHHPAPRPAGRGRALGAPAARGHRAAVARRPAARRGRRRPVARPRGAPAATRGGRRTGAARVTLLVLLLVAAPIADPGRRVAAGRRRAGAWTTTAR